MVAMVTPMQPDGSPCFGSIERLVQWHLAQGTQAIVAVGTTGESATLTIDERLQVIAAVIKAAAGRISVIAGTGSNSTTESIELSRAAAEMDIAACMLVCPYYNKPPQEGLYQHFRSIAEAVPSVPYILYNIPGRTAVDILPETVARLAQIDNIVGIKEAVDTTQRMDELVKCCRTSMEKKGFALLSGDDFSMVELMNRGGVGCISVTANVVPARVRRICDLALAGEREQARAANEQLMPLHRALFELSNPISAKWALNRMQLIPEGIRLPLIPLPAEQQQSLEAVLHDLELLT